MQPFEATNGLRNIRHTQEKDVDLLLVDSGDLHDGTGLSDGFPPGGVDAHDVGEPIHNMSARGADTCCSSRTSSLQSFRMMSWPLASRCPA